MKNLVSLALVASVLAWNVGCDRGTVGGPRAPEGPDNKAPVAGTSEGTFSLNVPNLPTRITQGESREISIALRRGTNFDQAVRLTFLDVPRGVTLDPANGSIASSENEAKFMIRAADDAAVGDHTVRVSGQGTAGPPATNTFTITVQRK